MGCGGDGATEQRVVDVGAASGPRAAWLPPAAPDAADFHHHLPTTSAVPRRQYDMLSKRGDYRTGKRARKTSAGQILASHGMVVVVARPDQAHIAIMPPRLASDGQVSGGLRGRN